MTHGIIKGCHYWISAEYVVLSPTLLGRPFLAGLKEPLCSAYFHLSFFMYFTCDVWHWQSKPCQDPTGEIDDFQRRCERGEEKSHGSQEGTHYRHHSTSVPKLEVRGIIILLGEVRIELFRRVASFFLKYPDIEECRLARQINRFKEIEMKTLKCRKLL